MPSQVPTSFASAAAAGTSQDWGARGGRADGGGVMDWSRQRTNGAATATFRRPSSATAGSQSAVPQPGQGQQAQSTAASGPGPYVPPHHYQANASRNGDVGQTRFTKEHLLNLYKAQKESGALGKNVAELIVGDWQPTFLGNGSSNTSNWNRKDDPGKEYVAAAVVCWDRNGGSTPLGLQEMTESEKEHFATSVNSPAKPPPQNAANKDPSNTVPGVSRKTSFTYGASNAGIFGTSSPTSARPIGRHREAADSYFADHPASAATGTSRNAKEEASAQTPPPPLLRRRTDLKEHTPSAALAEREKEHGGLRDKPPELLSSSSMLPSFPRRSVTLGAGATSIAPSSPWTSAGVGFSPMGSFGNFGADSSGLPPTPGERKPPLGGARGTSRWARLMNKGDADEGVSTDKLSVGHLGKLSEADTESASHDWGDVRANRPLGHDANPFNSRERPSASIGFGGTGDNGPAHVHHMSSSATPSAVISKEIRGLTDIANAPILPGLQDVLADRAHQLSGAHHGHGFGDAEPLSPTETNPFQSPIAEKADPEEVDTDGSEIQNLHHPALNNLPKEVLNGRYQNASNVLPLPFDNVTGEGSHHLGSTHQQKRFTGLPNIAGLTAAAGPIGWLPVSNSGPASRSDRDQSVFATDFGISAFSAPGDLQLPGLATPGGGFSASAFADAAAGPGAASGRGSRLVSLFPSAMHAQMHGGEPSHSIPDPEMSNFSSQTAAVENANRPAIDSYLPMFAFGARDNETPSRSSREVSEDLVPANAESGRDRFSADLALAANEQLARALTSAHATEPLLAPSSNASGSVGSSLTQSSQTTSAQPGGRQPQMVTGGSSQQSQAQQRTMVMPDRMRWIYRDPQGNIQGPWTGLEMHDWFKAGFFSAELLVKKCEDPDFEPLGQLIRRIGNSREPFLVPQIGIPYGPPSGQASSTWNGNNSTSGNQGSSPAGAVQPPFAGAFPSFGTTLTAEQQNALERRKQEEQFLMARQKEFLAQQQVLQKQIQQIHGVHPQQLHHHSSTHSLHSQPSFGSMTSHSGFHPHPTPPQGPTQLPQGVTGFFDAHMRHGSTAYMAPLSLGSDFGNAGPSGARDDELAALLARQNLNRDGQPLPHNFGASFHSQQLDNAGHAQQVAAILAQRAQLQREQAKHDTMLGSSSDEQQVPNDRLQQFNELRARSDEDYAQPGEGADVEPMAHTTNQIPMAGVPQQQPLIDSRHELAESVGRMDLAQDPLTTLPRSSPSPSSGQKAEVLSLTQQVQRAASEKQPPTFAPQAGSSSAQTDNAGLPQPFPPPPLPPPQSLSPLPAPAAQRNRYQLPDALAIAEESRARSQTSSVETPGAITSLAPWARDVSEGPKGPSLKEIQEAEARKAAEAEEAAAAARRLLLEQELQRLSQQAGPGSASPQGLPSTSTWGSGTSPATPTAPGASAWAKPLAGKLSSGVGEAGAKKTLSQIQHEEEARKQKAAAAALAAAATQNANASANAPAAATSSGKRYADLAGKAAPLPAAAAGNSGGAWTTVGATGKAKLPPPASGPAGSNASWTTSVRSTGSSGTAGAGVVATGKGKSASSAPAARKGSAAAAAGPVPEPPNAAEEFTKWAKSTLSKGLNSNINVDDFVQQLLLFPLDVDIISESVYANSTTMDGRRFAVEFLRRRKLAEKGIVEASGSGGSASSAATGSSSAAAAAAAAASSSLSSSMASSAFQSSWAAGGGKGSEGKNAGGWSEVAKKGPSNSSSSKDADNPLTFKVVAPKKKGRR